METINLEKCVPCHHGGLSLAEDQIQSLMVHVRGWERVTEDHIHKLRRTYTFKDFVHAMSFTNQVAKISEEEGHHPALLTEWGKVTVTWWTHVIKGLHRNDFILAARCDKLFEEQTESPAR